MMTAIETLSLSKTFPGGFGVHDLGLAVPPGSIYGFLGPNGAGKTTTIRLLLSLLKPDAGTIRIHGEPLDRRSRSNVGALVESPSLYGHLTGRENLEVTRRLIAAPEKRVDEVLRLIELEDSAHRLVRN